MKKGILTLIMLTLTSFIFAQNTAKELLDAVANKAQSYKNISIKFTHQLDNKQANVHQEALGNVILQGDLYHFSYMGTEQIYDGKNTYIILHEDEEVVVQPENAESDNTLTPSKLFTFYKKGYTYKMGKKKGSSQYVVLTPEDSSSAIKEISIEINSRNKQIKSIAEKGKNGTNTTIKVTSFETNQPISKKLFIFDESKFKQKHYHISRPN